MIKKHMRISNGQADAAYEQMRDWMNHEGGRIPTNAFAALVLKPENCYTAQNDDSVADDYEVIEVVVWNKMETPECDEDDLLFMFVKDYEDRNATVDIIKFKKWIDRNRESLMKAIDGFNANNEGK